MTRLLAILLLLPAIASAAGLGVYNPAQHAVNGFMPTQLPDLQLWLDVNRIGLTNGQSLNVWQDFSGKSNWATNGTASKQPTVSSINGRGSLSFDGVDDWLVVKDFQCTTFFSFFAVFKQQTNNNQLFYVEHGPNAISQDGFFLYGGLNGPVGVYRNSAVHYIAGVTDWASNTYNVCVFTYDGAARYLKNGVIGDNGAATGTARTNNTIVTKNLNLGSRDGPTAVISKMQLSEIIVCTNLLTSQLEKQVERYLGTKYGIVVQ